MEIESTEPASGENGLDKPLDSSKIQKSLRNLRNSKIVPPGNLREPNHKEDQKTFMKDLKAFCALHSHDRITLMDQMDKPEFKQTDVFKHYVPILDISDLINRNTAKYEQKMSWHALYAKLENLLDE